MRSCAAAANGWPDGRDGLIELVKDTRAAIPDLEVSVKRLIASEDEVVGWWAAKGTHSGEFLGVKPTGRRISGEMVSFFKIRDGRIVDYLVVLTDRLDLIRQMGGV